MDNDLQELKHDISVAVLKFRAKQHGMTREEYGSVYDSEAHEHLLVMLTRLVLISDDGGLKMFLERPSHDQ